MSHAGSRQIAVCGHLCLDIIPGFGAAMDGAPHDWFRPGRLSLVEAPVLSTGGAVSNVGLSLHRLGVPVRLVAKVGDDPLGGLIRERVAAHGPRLAEGLTVAPGEVTSYSIVISPPGVDRIFFHCPGANDTFTDSDVPDSVLQGVSIFHFGYPPLMKQIWSDGGGRLARLLSRARSAGALTSLDMSLPDPASPPGRIDWGVFLARVLPAVDCFVPSAEELLFMLDRPAFTRLAGNGGGDQVVRDVTFDELAGLAERALGCGVSAVMIKLGDRGAYLRTGARGVPGTEGWAGRELYSPVFRPTRIAGTVGSGDATIAGFLASIVRDLGPEESLTNAVAVGGCCVESPDATSGVRAWEETLGRVKSGWQRREASLPPGWTRTSAGVFSGPRDRARR